MIFYDRAVIKILGKNKKNRRGGILLKICDLTEEERKVLEEKFEKISLEMEQVNQLIESNSWDTNVVELCDSLIDMNESLLKIARINIDITTYLKDYVEDLVETQVSSNTNNVSTVNDK